MKSCVVDASVVLEAMFRDPLADCAKQVLTGGYTMLAPDLIYAEVAHVIKKRYVCGDIDEVNAQFFLEETRRSPWTITSCGDLAELALQLAIATNRSAYDCMYLALACVKQTVMITADKRLVNALANTPWAKHIAWLGDVS